MTEQHMLMPTESSAEVVTGARSDGEPGPIVANINSATAHRRLYSRWHEVGILLTGLGVLLLLFFVYLYAFTPLTHSRDQNRLLQSLVGSRTAVYSLVVGHLPSEGKPVAILTIPELNERQVVTMGTSSADLQQGPGLMEATALPGDPGNAVIAGRRMSFGAPFGSLDHLVPGNTIDVVDGAGRFTFRVVNISTLAGGYRDVVPGRGQSWITLVTSSSPLFDSGSLVVVAKSVSPLGPAVRPVNRGQPAVRLDFAGDRSGGYLGLAWGALFLLGLWVTVRAVRRWRQAWLTYLLSAPLLLACGLFACESVARMLPATL